MIVSAVSWPGRNQTTKLVEYNQSLTILEYYGQVPLVHRQLFFEQFPYFIQNYFSGDLKESN